MVAEALLVDDSRSALGLLKELAEANGTVQAPAFFDPLEALIAARNKKFDVVLVDYEMPKIDGTRLSAICVRFRLMPTFRWS
jgi:putative two-component system response regulator